MLYMCYQPLVLIGQRRLALSMRLLGSVEGEEAA